MSVLMFKVFMIASLLVPAQTLAQHRSIPEANLQVTPPSPPKLLPAAWPGRLKDSVFCSTQINSTPFARRVELPLARTWSGRLELTGFHSDVNDSAGSLGDSAFRATPLRPANQGASSNSFGLRMHFSFSRGLADKNPH
jgi:hypothetical protein